MDDGLLVGSVEGYPQYVRMANLAVIGSKKVNGVAELHSELVRTTILKDFVDYYGQDKVRPLSSTYSRILIFNWTAVWQCYERNHSPPLARPMQPGPKQPHHRDPGRQQVRVAQGLVQAQGTVAVCGQA